MLSSPTNRRSNDCCDLISTITMIRELTCRLKRPPRFAIGDDRQRTNYFPPAGLRPSPSLRTRCLKITKWPRLTEDSFSCNISRRHAHSRVTTVANRPVGTHSLSHCIRYSFTAIARSMEFLRRDSFFDLSSTTHSSEKPTPIRKRIFLFLQFLLNTLGHHAHFHDCRFELSASAAETLCPIRCFRIIEDVYPLLVLRNRFHIHFRHDVLLKSRLSHTGLRLTSHISGFRPLAQSHKSGMSQVVFTGPF